MLPQDMALDVHSYDAVSSTISQVRARGASRTDGANFGRICAKTEVVQNKCQKNTSWQKNNNWCFC